MHERSLHERTVAVLVTDGFEQVELTEPVQALRDAGARVSIISPQQHEVRGWNHTGWGAPVRVDRQLDQADPQAYDALLLPGGVMNPDTLRMNDAAVEFVRAFSNAGKPIAAICHGPWLLINAGAVINRTLTSYPSLRVDLENAGAHWVDRPVVTDNGIVTSRQPDDLPQFIEAMIELFAQGQAREYGGKQVSSAPNASFEPDEDRRTVGDSAAALAGNELSNRDYPRGNKREQR